MIASTRHKDHVIISPLLQLILIMMTTLYMSFIFYHRLAIFETNDPLPSYKVTTPEQYRAFGSFANEINVGLYIDEFENFNLLDNNFLFSGQIWFAFDPGIISLDTLEQFSFAYGTILSRSSARTSLINNKLFVRYSIRVQHISILDLTKFPLDNHRIYIQLEHQYISPSEVLFTAQLNDFMMKANTTIFGWKPHDTHTKAGYVQDILDPYDPNKTAFYPTVLFLIEFTRSSIQQVLTIFLPLLLIFFIILFCFSIREGTTSVSVATGSVSGILAYRFVIANISPRVGYFMLSDYIFFLFLAASIVVFLINIFDIYYKPFRLFMKQLLLVCIHLSVNAITTYLLFT